MRRPKKNLTITVFWNHNYLQEEALSKAPVAAVRSIVHCSMSSTISFTRQRIRHSCRTMKQEPTNEFVDAALQRPVLHLFKTRRLLNTVTQASHVNAYRRHCTSGIELQRGHQRGHLATTRNVMRSILKQRGLLQARTWREEEDD